MRAVCIVTMSVCLPMFGLAQVSGGTLGGGGFAGATFASGAGNGISSIYGMDPLGPGAVRGPISIGSLQTNLRFDPPSGVSPRGVTGEYQGRSVAGKSYFKRTLMDGTRHEYFGYEVLVEEQQPGTYLATFGKSGVSLLEGAVTADASMAQWSVRTLALPEPKVVRDGDIISIELMRDAATGERLTDEITIQPFSRGRLPIALAPRVVVSPGNRPVPTVVRPVPTVEGTARDFSAADGEMRLLQPRATLNGTPLPVTARASIVTGSLVWCYLPGRGRYVLSLVPHPELDFQKAGEIRGGTITLKLGGDAITLESPGEVTSGGAPYNLYVLRDPEWEPTAQAQKGEIAFGSVGT